MRLNSLAILWWKCLAEFELRKERRGPSTPRSDRFADRSAPVGMTGLKFVWAVYAPKAKSHFSICAIN
jgi:hypothetical protein